MKSHWTFTPCKSSMALIFVVKKRTPSVKIKSPKQNPTERSVLMFKNYTMWNTWGCEARSKKLYDLLQSLSRAMEFKKANACKIQTAAPTSCLTFFKMSFTKGTLYTWRYLFLFPNLKYYGYLACLILLGLLVYQAVSLTYQWQYQLSY